MNTYIGICILVYCLIMWAISIPLFRPEDNVANHTVRLFAPIALPVMLVVGVIGGIVRNVRTAPVMSIGTVLVAMAFTELYTRGYALAWVIATYAIALACLGLLALCKHEVRAMHFTAFALAPFSVPLLGLIALADLVGSKRKLPAAPPTEDPTDPTQDG